ncbi:hypothetical protein FDECE_8837 [Fusarium decemcellulare]|nr:hypothetical protein FDECE_8837 [Fusarium decemcellulare]
MCRHNPNTICGVDPQVYVDKLRTETRFRLFLCKPTQADIAYLSSQQRDQEPVGPRAIARACGLNFGRDALGRILLSKFMTQIKYIEKRIKRARENGQHLHFEIRGSAPVLQPPPGVVVPRARVNMGVATPPQDSLVQRPQSSKTRSGFLEPKIKDEPIETTTIPSSLGPNNTKPVKVNEAGYLNSLADQLGTKLNV